MKDKKLSGVLFLLFFLLFSTSFSQQPFDIYPNGANSCGTVNFTNFSPIPNFIGGTCKPPRSDIGGAPQGLDYFPILVVFVTFANEPDFTGYGWHAGQAPDYMDSVISLERQPDNSDWWNTYNAFQMSDYWHEFSRGKLHIRGQAIHVPLIKTEAEYLQPGGGGTSRVYKDIYDYLISLGSQIYWPTYDKWTNTGGNGQYIWQPDGRVDMIYIVFRHDPLSLISGAEGFCPQSPAEGEDLSGNYLVYNQGGVQVNIASGVAQANASGIVVNGRGGFTTRDLYLEVAVHEHGHYLFEDHDIYGKMAYGPGREFSLSPWESIKLGYLTQKYPHFGDPTHILGDITSRYGHAGDEGEVIQVPITEDGNEFFLLANRRKVSDWDRRMAGDTVPHEKGFLKNINSEYGKGLYIYHCRNGYNMIHGTYWDMECADGLWDWENNGVCFPDWGPGISKCGYRRNNVSYLNDNSNFGNSSYNRDGLSFCYSPGIIECGGPGGLWFSIGKIHTIEPFTYGTDRIYTNFENLWYSLESCGDRWDAWNVGYNEVFSPYSSPNTNDWNNSQPGPGIFIWYSALNSDDAILKIYRTGYGGYNEESQILAETPPSRPMGLKIYWTECINGISHPKITWKHNREPDMATLNEEKIEVKRYIVKRAYANVNTVPAYYQIIADDYFLTGSDPEFIDNEIWINCFPYHHSMVVRYKVIAVDNDNKQSVPSDFVASPIDGINLPDNFSINLAPKEFILNQNYPNPFNPVTNIKYDLPKDVFVSIKVYDLLGREIKTLVNEFKNAGSYLVSFNGSEFASGIYFYRIQAGSFIQVKRMVLIK
jgi:hypothetical protein